MTLLRYLDPHAAPLSLVIGAVLGTAIGVAMHRRRQEAKSTAGVKAVLGLTLGLSAIVFGLTAQWWVTAFESPEVELPLGAIGSFVFSFLVFDRMWTALGGNKS
jgi:hypothetical protein